MVQLTKLDVRGEVIMPEEDQPVTIAQALHVYDPDARRHPGYDAFCWMMRGRYYGGELLNQAWSSFKKGWEKDEKLRLESVADPTTAAIDAANVERDRLRAEISRLADEVASLRRFLDAEKAQCTGIVERSRAVAAERDRLRAWLGRACDELDATGGELARQWAAAIREEAGIAMRVHLPTKTSTDNSR